MAEMEDSFMDNNDKIEDFEDLVDSEAVAKLQSDPEIAELVSKLKDLMNELKEESQPILNLKERYDNDMVHK